MSIIKYEKCDLCGHTVDVNKDRYWADNFNGGAFSIKPDGFNGMTYFWDNLCRSCREDLCKAIYPVINKLKDSQVKKEKK